MTAKEFIETLALFKNEKELNKAEKFFKGNDGITKSFGTKFGDVFSTAKEFSELSLADITKLLARDLSEVTIGAVRL
ncbi:hypothetical protein, partial [Chryseobacterium sp.]|uniref:hypothetical protein n=1 Tax=Chryseobacterium sp. TaxID=1871047 RepID=UPI0023F79F19